MTIKYLANHHQLINIHAKFDFLQDPCETNQK